LKSFQKRGYFVTYKILIVDDDADLCKLLSLKIDKSEFEVMTARNGIEGLHDAYEYKPDLIILDVMMPEMDGFETLKRLRELSDVPIIILTAKTDEKDILYGFKIGADDYIRKPFSRNELTARMMAVLNRKLVQGYQNSQYDDGILSINLSQQCVYKRGQHIHLTKIEFRLLSHLLSHQGTVVSHKSLLREVWGTGYEYAKSLLSLYIRYLRQKIEDDPENPVYIRTEWGVGYQFAPNVHAYNWITNSPTRLAKKHPSIYA
jgi:two-component system KDP operon response regulator KdpE